MAGSAKPDSIRAVLELRAAAVEHGKALAVADSHGAEVNRNELLSTRLELEAKTVAAIDECG